VLGLDLQLLEDLDAANVHPRLHPTRVPCSGHDLLKQEPDTLLDPAAAVQLVPACHVAFDRLERVPEDENR